MKCLKCGYELPDDSVRCLNCGESVVRKNPLSDNPYANYEGDLKDLVNRSPAAAGNGLLLKIFAIIAVIVLAVFLIGKSGIFDRRDGHYESDTLRNAALQILEKEAGTLSESEKAKLDITCTISIVRHDFSMTLGASYDGMKLMSDQTVKGKVTFVGSRGVIVLDGYDNEVGTIDYDRKKKTMTLYLEDEAIDTLGTNRIVFQKMEE